MCAQIADGVTFIMGRGVRRIVTDAAACLLSAGVMMGKLISWRCAVICPDCKQYRHSGPCDPVYEDDEGPDLLEILAMDAEAAQRRYQEALAKREAEKRNAA